MYIFLLVWYFSIEISVTSSSIVVICTTLRKMQREVSNVWNKEWHLCCIRANFFSHAAFSREISLVNRETSSVRNLSFWVVCNRCSIFPCFSAFNVRSYINTYIYIRPNTYVNKNNAASVFCFFLIKWANSGELEVVSPWFFREDVSANKRWSPARGPEAAASGLQ